MIEKIKKIIIYPEIIRNRLLWKKCKKKLKYIGKESSIGVGFVIRGEKNICIGDNFLCGKNVKLETWEYYNKKSTEMIPELIIGSNVTITDNCFISCLNKIEIGDGVLLGSNTFICDNYHGRNSVDELEIRPSMRELWSKGPVKIGKNVWVGRNVCIMPNVSIGDNSIIGANAVVTHDIPNNCIAVGIPARIIRNLKEDTDNIIN